VTVDTQSVPRRCVERYPGRDERPSEAVFAARGEGLRNSSTASVTRPRKSRTVSSSASEKSPATACTRSMMGPKKSHPMSCASSVTCRMTRRRSFSSRARDTRPRSSKPVDQRGRRCAVETEVASEPARRRDLAGARPVQQRDQGKRVGGVPDVAGRELRAEQFELDRERPKTVTRSS